VTDRSREDRVLVATADSEVVAGVRLDATADRGAGLSRPGVRDDRTGAGIGGRLLDAAQQRAREAGWGRA